MTICYLLNLRVSTQVLVTMGLQWLVNHSVFTNYDSFFFLNFHCTLILIYGPLQLVLNMEQGLPVLPEWLVFNRINARARKDLELGPARFLLRYGRFVFVKSRTIEYYKIL